MESMSQNEINFTWGEQLSTLPLELSSEHPLPADWNTERSEPSIVQCTLSSAGIWVFNGLFTEYECNNWRKASLDIGYDASHEITPIGQYVLNHSVSTGTPLIWPASTSIRTNKRCIWQVPRFEADCLYARLITYWKSPLVMSDVGLWESSGLNRRWRFFETSKDEEFQYHIDAACARENSERSFASLVIWLNDDFEGGELDFDNGISIKPVKGNAVLFWHDGHPDAKKHRGRPVIRGVKYLIRTDVFYKPVRTL